MSIITQLSNSAELSCIVSRRLYMRPLGPVTACL